MKMNEMYPSKYLSKEDLPAPRVVTISHITRERVKGERGEEDKTIAYFNGDVKPLILNKGNATMLCELYGDDSDRWHGKLIEIYNDPNVMFGAKRVGGVRMRSPARFGQQPAPIAAQPATNGEVLYDVSDGKVSKGRLTFGQVQQFINDGKFQAAQVRVREHGVAGAVAQTADEYGFLDATDDDPIPF